MVKHKHKKHTSTASAKHRILKHTRHIKRAARIGGRVAKATVRPFFRLQFILLFLITVCILVGAFVAITYLTFANDITSKEKIMNRRNSGIIIYDKNGQTLLQEGQAHEYKITPISGVSKDMVNATLAAEDLHFYTHPGISITSLAASLIADFRHLDPFKYGGSTITQQLVKNSLLGHEKSYSRKLREIVLAIEIERRYTKDEILEMYLNSVYYGAGAYGVSEAARVYFNEDASKLTLAQSAFLAGLPNAPSYLSPYGGNKEKAYERQRMILREMADNALITPAQENEVIKDQLVFAPYKPTNIVKAPHFALWVRDKLLKQFNESDAERLGYRVYTTLDLNMQQIAEEEVARRVNELKSQKVSNGSLVAMDPKTGGILAMVGSADYNNDEIGGKYNVAVDGIGRQPGSSFKPLVYVSAFERKLLTPASIMQDKPTDFGEFAGEHFRPKNYDGKYRGNVSVRKALANSLNIPAVEALRMVGVDTALDTAQRLGITTLNEKNRYGLSLVLGGGEVHLLEMVQAYEAIANNGKLYPYYSIEKIQDKFGNTIYEHKDHAEPAKQVLIPAASYLITHILSDNNARAEVFGSNSPLRLSRPAAAKTGTTDNYKDSWTLGYTPNLVAGAWIGNNDGTQMLGVAGAIGAANVWKNFMERALRTMPVENFTEPEGVVRVKSCQKIQTKEVRYLDDGTPYDHFEDKIIGIDDVFMEGTQPRGGCEIIESPNPSSPSADPTVQSPNPQPTPQTQNNLERKPEQPQQAQLPPGYIVDPNPNGRPWNISVRDDRIVVQ